MGVSLFEGGFGVGVKCKNYRKIKGKKES